MLLLNVAAIAAAGVNVLLLIAIYNKLRRISRYFYIPKTSVPGEGGKHFHAKMPGYLPRKGHNRW